MEPLLLSSSLVSYQRCYSAGLCCSSLSSLLSRSFKLTSIFDVEQTSVLRNLEVQGGSRAESDLHVCESRRVPLFSSLRRDLTS